MKDVDERNKYKDEVYDLITRAYASIGGIKGNGFNSADDMVDNLPMWKLVKKDNQIVAGRMYKDKNGRKSVASFTDGSRAGIIELAKIFKIEGSRSYTEISSKALAFMIKLIGIDGVKKIAIPVDRVKTLLKGDDIGEPDKHYTELYPDIASFFYSRKIGLSSETKIALGIPENTIVE